MNSTKFGLFALIFLFGATILVPTLLPDIASADCGANVRDCDRCVDRCAYDGDLLRCDSGAVRDYDRGAAGYCENCASEYRCNLYGCAWGR